jgi:hypothetical protein
MLTTFEKFNNDNEIWYHGSYNDDITSFKTRRDTTKSRMGIYFSDTEKESKRYGKYIYVVKLHLEKTLDLTPYGEQGIDNYEKLLRSLPIPETELNDLMRKQRFYGYDYFSPYKVLEILDREYHIVPKLKKKGYDSIKFKEGVGTTAVVFWSSLVEIIKQYQRERNYNWGCELKESKQVGFLYHWTTLDNLKNILKDDRMISLFHFISFSRNKNLNYNNHPVKITFDGDRMSHHFKIRSHLYHKDPYFKHEAEERVECNSHTELNLKYDPSNNFDCIKGINKYIIGIEYDSNWYPKLYKKDLIDDLDKVNIFIPNIKIEIK